MLNKKDPNWVIVGVFFYNSVEILYYNRSFANTGDITLSKSMINFKIIKIFFGSTDGIENYVEVYNNYKNNSICSLQEYHPASDGTVIYGKAREVRIDGNTIKTIDQRTSEWIMNTSSCTIFNQNNKIAITAVLGYK